MKYSLFSTYKKESARWLCAAESMRQEAAWWLSMLVLYERAENDANSPRAARDSVNSWRSLQQGEESKSRIQRCPYFNKRTAAYFFKVSSCGTLCLCWIHVEHRGGIKHLSSLYSLREPAIFYWPQPAVSVAKTWGRAEKPDTKTFCNDHKTRNNRFLDVPPCNMWRYSPAGYRMT